MFYSQFILAKKGPLGTIWIAAHLERKLRKNQVAETDIGNSVDSIIFPDVPIALRLSSHLLLGVVRIYSRKVNYLFDDCSEALLKVKQAFRSTAVDLPPEESTAPYHSITLPETFDLDDFELPDADIFQGNYVDHHISNKEQITLQDTMDGVVYSTSQFGLDERFGDGDTSQLGLDPEEDLLLNNLPAPENARDGMDLDHPDESIMNENHGELSETTETMQAKPIGPEADNGNNELLEYAQAPSTPGLVEEPNLFNQKTSEFDEHFELENHLTESVSHGNRTETLCSSPPGKNMEVKNTEENGHMPVEQMIKQSEPESNSNLETQGVMLGEACDLNNASDQPCPNTGDLPENYSSFLSNGCQLDGQGTIHHETSNGITVSCQADESSSPKNELPSSGLVSLGGADSLQALRACNSDVNLHDTLSKGKEDTRLDKLSECPATLDKGDDVQGDSIKVQGNFQDTDTTTELADEMNQSADTFQQVQEKPSRSNEKTECSVTKHGDEISSSPPPMAELPAPEKLLSVPEQHTELPTDFLPNTTPEEVLSVISKDGAGVTTGQKRSFTESTPTMDSLHTAESSGKDGLRKTAESIPNDEDLLSSILVGRRSSILKLKPTPTQTEVVSMKRPRTASRSNTYKRKVLMDDTMVLHGDMIREQLVSTEDIRRVRKKAPCTRQEIWMIQKQFMEEDIVYDPISTGMSMELVCLHNQAYELSGISITKDNEPMAPTESTHEMQHPQDDDDIPDTHEGAIEETNKETQLGTTSFQIENQQGEGDTSCVSHDNSELPKGDSADPSSLPKSLEQAHISEMEIDGKSDAVDEAAEKASSLPTESSSSACVIPADAAETAAGFAKPLAEITNGCNSGDYEAFSLKHSREEFAHNCAATVNDENGSPIRVKSGTVNELLSKEVNNDGCVEDNEFSGPLTATETHDHETLDNEGNNESRPFSVDHDAFMKMEQKETFNEFCEPQSQANGITDVDNVVVEDYNGMDYVTAEHDTGFLNVDDDDLEADESYMPSIEETRSNIVDNSGWSSRSRAVGKYLQIMFDKEAEHGNNVIPMDNLLSGKSRREASRMFFETLVLKTRDYIQVEQTIPFNKINLRPRSMLMKSDF
ncbi:unnamed protein product [Rhodiola kirilowii]